MTPEPSVLSLLFHSDLQDKHIRKGAIAPFLLPAICYGSQTAARSEMPSQVYQSEAKARNPKSERGNSRGNDGKHYPQRFHQRICRHDRWVDGRRPPSFGPG